MENGDKSGNTYHDSADPGFNGQFSPVFIAGFIKHVLDMGFDSVLGNAQLTGNVPEEVLTTLMDDHQQVGELAERAANPALQEGVVPLDAADVLEIYQACL